MSLIGVKLWKPAAGGHKKLKNFNASNFISFEEYLSEIVNVQFYYYDFLKSDG